MPPLQSGMQVGWKQSRLAGRLGVLLQKSTCFSRVSEEGADFEGGPWIEFCENGLLRDAVEALGVVVEHGKGKPHLSRSLVQCVLRRCVQQRDLVLGKRVHHLAIKTGFESDTLLATQFIQMYAGHGRLQEATKAFTDVPVPDIFMWESIILVHVRREQHRHAITLYKRMRNSPLKPNSYIFVAVLKACASTADLAAGKEIHVDILHTFSKINGIMGTCLVEMYAKCGRLDDARRVFDTLAAKDVILWTAMISAYAQRGLGQEALDLYASMVQQDKARADHFTYACLLKACASIGALHEGKVLHGQIRNGGLQDDMIIGACLVDMYAKCGSLEDARKVFESLSKKDVVTWTAMITGYAQCGLGKESLSLYARMQQEGLSPVNHVTFVSLLNACASAGAFHDGKKLHSQIQKRGLETDTVIGNCLVDMYAKCGCLEDARKVFDSLPNKDIVTWNTMLAGYSQKGLGQESLDLYAIMPANERLSADSVTYVCLLKACADLGALHMGRHLHFHIQEGGLASQVAVGSSLVDMYAKCGELVDAHRLFDRLPMKDVVTWTALIAGYVEHGRGEEALTLYSRMQQVGIMPADHVTFSFLLKACAAVGAVDRGKQLHVQVQCRGLEGDVAGPLVNMYAKCGHLEDACQVFTKLHGRDVVTWNAMISGFGQHGLVDAAVVCYEKMRVAGIRPDEITFLALISACSHAGLVDRGIQYFESMSIDYGLTPDIEHYVTLLDLLGRAGCMVKAAELLSTIPMQPNLAVWLCLLGACRKHGNVGLGEEAFRRAVSLEPKHPAAYVLMAHIYSDAGLLDEALRMQGLRERQGAWKNPGRTWIELGHEIHTFVVGE